MAGSGDVITVPAADLREIPTPAGTAQKPAPSDTPPRTATNPATGIGGPTVPGSTASVPPPPAAPGTNGSPVAPGAAPAAPMVAGAASPDADAPAVPSAEAAIDLDKVNMSLRDYRTLMSENPIGTNAEITRALNGGNPKQARLVQEGLAINPNGELVDRWGTPYFFHQLSKDHMEIRSAGPDRQMETNDDVVSN